MAEDNLRIKAYYIEDDVIVVNRELTKLDMFVKDFLSVLKNHSEYLVVSGFVSISTGRTRGTEDVDVLFSKLDKEKFSMLFNELIKNKFWCYQGDTSDEVFSYVEAGESIRFAKDGEMFPNIEFIPVNESKKAKYFELTHPQKIRIQDFEFNIPPIEFEILYKEIVLASKKDIEDARHLRVFFSDIIKEERFKEYEPIIRGELR